MRSQGICWGKVGNQAVKINFPIAEAMIGSAAVCTSTLANHLVDLSTSVRLSAYTSGRWFQNITIVTTMCNRTGGRKSVLGSKHFTSVTICIVYGITIMVV